MAGTQVKMFKVGSVQRRTVLQLLFCQCFILAVAVISGANAFPMLFACLLSFLLMLNIPYNLHLLEMTLDRLARGLPVESISFRLRWPLTGLFVLVNALGQQTGHQVQLEQRNVAYRDQLLQQVGKTAAQEERNRLARDLHDSIKQQIFSIVVSAAAVKARWEHNSASARKIVDDIERTAQEAQVEMQALLQQLRPTALENVGLIESLRMQCQALGYRTGAEVNAELGDLPPDELFPIGAQEMIFRIVQEGFANIARHARASHVWLSLQRQRDALLVEIGDDGQGFDLAQANERPNTYGGMGLSNVRERISTLGGTIAIWSLPGKGTTLHLCIPLVHPELQAQEQEHISQELANAVRKTRRILRVGRWAAELVAVLMLLYTPAYIARWPAFICIIVALASWLWAQQRRLHIALALFGRGEGSVRRAERSGGRGERMSSEADRAIRGGKDIAMREGKEHAQHLARLSESYGLLSGTLLLCMLYPNYFASLRYALYSTFFVLPLAAVFIIAIVVTYVRYSQNIGRYYKTLSREVLQEQMRRQLQQIVIDWLAWAITVVLTVFLLNAFPTILTDAAVQAMGFVLLFVWFIVILLKSVRIAHWHHRLLRVTNEM